MNRWLVIVVHASVVSLCASPASAVLVDWLNVSAVNGQTVSHPIFGNVRVTWVLNSGSTLVTTLDNGGGSLGPDTWSDSHRLNFIDNSTAFTATARFSFLDAPINPSDIYLNVIGLGRRGTDFSSLSVDQNVTFLGGWLTANGPSTQIAGTESHTWDASSSSGLNTNGELHTLTGAGPINSLEFDIAGIIGDGFGMNIGAVAIPEPSSLLCLGVLGIVTIGIRRIHKH